MSRTKVIPNKFHSSSIDNLVDSTCVSLTIWTYRQPQKCHYIELHFWTNEFEKKKFVWISRLDGIPYLFTSKIYLQSFFFLSKKRKTRGKYFKAHLSKFISKECSLLVLTYVLGLEYSTNFYYLPIIINEHKFYLIFFGALRNFTVKHKHGVIYWPRGVE